MTTALIASAVTDPADSWTRREILQQPETLLATQAILQRDGAALSDFLAPLLSDPALRIVLAGAGTSAFIGESIAPYLSRAMGRPVEAIATTDIVSAPHLHFRRNEPTLLLSFGRSGNSPESIAAVELVDAMVDAAHHLIVTCNPDGALARRRGAGSHVVLLPEATHDRGFAMTSSYTAMMLAALSGLSGPDRFASRVPAIARAVGEAMACEGAMIDLAARRFERVVYLGSGVFKGLAREAALKLLELSDGQVAIQFETALGFRHGPKTFVDKDTLVVAFLSNDPLTRRYDLDIADEVRADGNCGALCTISAQPGDHVDVLVPGMATADDADLLFPFIVPAQLLALHVSLTRGVTPDTPNPAGVVNRVVQGVRIHPLPA